MSHATTLEVRPDTNQRPIQPQVLSLHTDFIALYEEGLAQSQTGEHVWRRPRFLHMTQLLGLTAGIPGATAEAGVFRGLGSYLICRTRRAEDAGFDGTGHFAIDSFEGLPEVAEIDGPTAAKGRFSDTSVEHVRQTLATFPGVSIVKGWIPEAFDDLPEQTYRFVHIDVDLHDATRDSLHYFYPRMSQGGIIVIDDYGPWPNGAWPGCMKATKDFCAEYALAHAALDTGNAFIIKRAH